jgi:AAA family ATP:ADP antiporter
MTQPAAQPASSPGDLLQRFAKVERAEVAALVWSFAFFLSVLCSYYIIRPVREEMGVTVGRRTLEWLFSIVFLVMLAAVPMFGWVASSFPRKRIVAIVYGFFSLNLLAFWQLLSAGKPSVGLAGCFFVWVSVFNLFVVSLFWSVMADTWRAEQAKRLYGFVAAGGSVGALLGPLITQSLVHAIGPTNLLLVSVLLLTAAIGCATALGRARLVGARADAQAQPLTGGGIFAGARNVWASPYLFRIALWVLLANLISTYFYLEQAQIVGQSYANPADRVQLFARMDLTVSILTIAAQLLLTGRVISRIGVAVAASALPIVASLGLVALAIAPVVAVIVTVMVLDRAVTFAFSNPALRVLFTVVAPEDKYKAQSFIDTVVFRGGDAASGWVFHGLGKGLGLGMSAIALLTLPLSLLWVALSFALGRQQQEQATREPARADA